MNGATGTDGWAAWVDGQLDAVRAAGRWRTPRTFDGRGVQGTVDGRAVVTYASNDYLGLTGHPEVRAAAAVAAQRWGTGSGASRLVVGSRPVHDELEAELAEWAGCERALLWSSGFAANLSVLSVLGGPEVVVVSDELNHASIIDGCRASGSEVVVARHGDVGHVADLVDAAVRSGRRALVVTDAVFSMDGDVAPVAALASVCDRTGSVLVVDEAHSVLDGHVEVDLDPALLVRVGTLSKSLGSVGGFVAATAPVVDLLINRARPFIFSTATTPADAAAALAALRILRGVEGNALVARLRAVVDRVRPGHPSPILPVVIGEEVDTLAAADALLERGVHIPAIRPPTVPPGTCRLRVALSAEHTDDMIGDLVAALEVVVGPDALQRGTAATADNVRFLGA
jgi:8-amino-7-oxononanoate synthase